MKRRDMTLTRDREGYVFIPRSGRALDWLHEQFDEIDHDLTDDDMEAIARRAEAAGFSVEW